jgi:CBS domain-containing protein
MRVETVLKMKGPAVATIGSDATVATAVGELKKHGIGALVVSDDGTSVAGILSERDVVRALATDGESLLTRKVSALMTRDVRVCRPEDDLNTIMGDMTRGRFRHLPVVRNGQLCGIVSIGDVVKNRLEEIEFEANSLRSFIAGG